MKQKADFMVWFNIHQKELSNISSVETNLSHYLSHIFVISQTHYATAAENNQMYYYFKTYYILFAEIFPCAWLCYVFYMHYVI